MRRLLVNAMLLLAVVAGMDFGLAQMGQALMPDWSLRAHRLKFRIPDPVFHHGLAPQVVQIDSWGRHRYPMVTNSLGGRDREARVVPLTGDRPRIAFIGDSFVEGVGYPYEETFVGLVDAALAPAGVEVLNLGVSSYSPLLDWRKAQYMIETAGLKIDELVVFVDPGDIYNEAWWYELTPDGRLLANNLGGFNIAEKRGTLGDWFAVNSVLGKLGYTAADAWRYHRARAKAERHEAAGAPSFDIDTMVQARDSRWTWDEEAWETWGRKGLDRALASLDRLHALAGRHGVRLTVATYPWPADIWHRRADSRHRTAILDWARERGVAAIDLYPAFLAGEPKTVLEEMFVPGDVHWNDRGHQLVASQVLAALRQR